MTMSKRYLCILGDHPWTRHIYDDVIRHYPGDWACLSHLPNWGPDTHNTVRYIFFIHWSERVPNWLTDEYECVGFHMTKLPYGRGGSPLQNLLIRRATQTILTAFRLVEKYDAGPIYRTTPLSLNGTAEEIYLRESSHIAHLIEMITLTEPEPIPQVGRPTIFERRTSDQSRINDSEFPSSLTSEFDFIRMLDAEGYPRAFLDHGGFRYTFSHPVLRDGRIDARVEITKL